MVSRGRYVELGVVESSRDATFQPQEFDFINGIDNNTLNSIDQTGDFVVDCRNPSFATCHDQCAGSIESSQWLDAESSLDGIYYVLDGSDGSINAQPMLAPARNFEDEALFLDANLASNKEKYGGQTAYELPTQSLEAEETTDSEQNRRPSRTPKNKQKCPRPDSNGVSARECGDFMAGDVSAFRMYCEARFEAMLVKPCKSIAAKIIDIFCPYKSHEYPYRNSKGESDFRGPRHPSWWPSGMKYASPHHMEKQDLFQFLSYVVALPLTDPVSYRAILARTKDATDWTSLLEKSLNDTLLRDTQGLPALQKDQKPVDRRNIARLNVFREIFFKAGYVARVANGEMDGDMAVHYGRVSDECFLRSKNGAILSDNYNKGRSKRRRQSVGNSWAETVAGGERGSSQLLQREQCPSPESIPQPTKKRRTLAAKHQCFDEMSFPGADSNADNQLFSSLPPPHYQPDSLSNDLGDIFEMPSAGSISVSNENEVTSLEPMTVASTAWCSPELVPREHVAMTGLHNGQGPNHDLQLLKINNAGEVGMPSFQSAQLFHGFVDELEGDNWTLRYGRNWPHAVEYNLTDMQMQEPSYIGPYDGYPWTVPTCTTRYPDALV